MEQQTLIQMFRSLASEIAEKDFGHVAPEHRISDLGIDSLGMLELVGSMERELRIHLPDEQLAGIQTVQQLLDVVHQKLQHTVSS